MLKNSAIKRITISSLALVIMLLICVFPTNTTLSIPQEVIYTEEITTPIYAMDKNKYIARTSLIKNDTEDEIKYIINALTKNSLTSNYLPNGFIGTIPENTKLINYSLDNGLLKLNFSKELFNVTQEDEEKLIESLIYSLCEVKDVSSIMIFVEDSLLTKLPKSNKELPEVLDKNYGINKTYHINDIKNTSKTTIYYISKYNDNFYYIPITKITNDDAQPVEIIVNELKNTPIYETNLISYLNASYELQDYEILENSITLSFNNDLIANLMDKDITEKVRYTLSLSLRDTYNIENIIINLN